MPGKPRCLTLFLDSWYGRGGPIGSSESMQFGNGLFEQMGYDEIHIPMEMWRDDQEAAAIKIKMGWPYGFAFVVPFQEISYRLRDLLRRVPIIAWMSDDVWRYRNFGRFWAEFCDFIVTTDQASAEKYGDKGILSNWACRPEWASHVHPGGRSYRAGFIGQMYGGRPESLARFKLLGVDVLSSNTLERELSQTEYFNLMSRGIFSLCLTASSHGRPQMKSRLFEPQVLGSILVTEPVEGLDKYWHPGEECVVFHSPEEAQAEMSRLLADPVALTDMRERARARALAEHTYRHRFEKIFAHMGLPAPVGV